MRDDELPPATEAAPGRRSRVRLRAVGGVGVLVAAGVAFGFSGLPGSQAGHDVVGAVRDRLTGGPGDAEVVDAADVCAAVPWADDDGTIEEPPRAGDLPDGFTPVAVVECRRPSAMDPAPAPPPEDVRLEGDLRPLRDLLADSRDTAGAESGGEICPAIGYLRQDLYLVDTGGRAVRVDWPTGVCGEPLPEVRSALDDLDVVAAWPSDEA